RTIQLFQTPKLASDFDFDNRGKGLFFEYDPIQEALIPEAGYSDENARGIWILRRKNKFWCRVFRKDPENPPAILASNGHAFTLDGLKPFGASLKLQDFEESEMSDESDNLSIVLGLLIDVKRGKRRLLPTS